MRAALLSLLLLPAACVERPSWMPLPSFGASTASNVVTPPDPTDAAGTSTATGHDREGQPPARWTPSPPPLASTATAEQGKTPVAVTP